jgi:hypothetical protein
LAYPNAERRNAARGPGASHLVDERRGQAGAAATKRVTDRYRAAVDVQFLMPSSRWQARACATGGKITFARSVRT